MPVWAAPKRCGLSHMRAGVLGPRGRLPTPARPRELRRSRTGAVQGPAGGVVAAQALRTPPDGVLAAEGAPHPDAEPGAAPPPRLLGELQGDPLDAHDIVPADHAL